MRKFLIVCAASFMVPIPALAADASIDELIVATSIPKAQSTAIIETARHFYTFWNTGDEKSLVASISPHFIDHTLPPGRPQGPQGPAFASKTFRAAVPDLKVEVRKMVVAVDTVTVHMVFTGHFTGTFGTTQGQGQPISFVATDLLKITDGRISDNWHIEDNLALLTQMDVATVKP